jgi:sugar/nucleoside kinase (ribokinase family)
LSSGGERTIVMCRGTSDNLLETNPNWEEILDCSWVFLSELAGTNHDFIFELVKNIKKRGIRLSYIPGQRELDLGIKLGSILERADILVCNGYEAERILGRGGSPEKTLRAFKDLGVGIPVITLGPKGSFAYDGKEVYRQGADPKVKVIDRTGAGDAFSATFTGGIMLGRSVPESLSMAAKNASSVIAKVGGTDGLLSLPQLEE